MSTRTETASSPRKAFVDPIQPALTVGAITGTFGLLSGGAAGILRSTPPLLFSIAAGVQCFSLGTSFWYFRGALLQTWASVPPSSGEKTKCSTLAGTLAGATSGALRSRANIIPGAIVFSGLGFLGQGAFNIFDTWRIDTYEERQKPILQRMSQSKWFPMKSIPDDDYARTLKERSMNLDAEIALIDEKIEALKSQRRV